MAPDNEFQEQRQDRFNGTATAGENKKAAEAALKVKLLQKRTKTGCLTCRKRRIKCGEERPECRNCAKSKRHCEGYSQRVVFKPPAFDYRPVPNGAHIIFQAGAGQASHPLGDELHDLHTGPGGFAHLGPEYASQYAAGINAPVHQYLALAQHQQQMQQQMSLGFPPLPQPHHQSPYDQAGGIPNHPIYQPIPHVQHLAGTPELPINAPSAVSYFGPHQISPPVSSVPAMLVQNEQQTSPSESRNRLHHNAPIDHYPPVYQNTTPPVLSSSTQAPFPIVPDQGLGITEARLASLEDPNYVPPPTSAPSGTFVHPQTPMLYSRASWGSDEYTPWPALTSPPHHAPQTQTPAVHDPLFRSESSDHEVARPTEAFAMSYIYQCETFDDMSKISPSHLLSAAAVEMQDDDYFDVGSDEDMDVEMSTIHGHAQDGQQTISRLLAMNQINIRDVQSRRYDTFLYVGILDHYRVEEVANPLKNAATARVFAHFISATGPSLSIFERHPRNSSILFSKTSIPFSQQGLWTYTMPMAALRHQGLLHAMLALASLHIARLQGASTTPSMQHYAWALKRIHHCVGHQKKRLKLTTIAASLLLGFYEVMTAEHMKWNTHLAGSKQLFVETDFTKMTHQFCIMKRDRAALSQLGPAWGSDNAGPFSPNGLLDQIPTIDERVISRIVGREVRYDDHGRVESPPHTKAPRELDLHEFETLKDLYWWYCKQDVYQSIVSGNPLLMDFSRWADCPPRAPLGKSDAVYGSFDHLILLLGRIAEFSSKDRERKLKQMESNGGSWKPAPGMKISRPPQSASPHTPKRGNESTSAPTTGQPTTPAVLGPQFYGMAPPPKGALRMPASYFPSHSASSTPYEIKKDPLEYDLQAATNAAMQEYGRIRSALHTFSTSLGEAFEPLTSEYQPTMDTPFGPAIFYRSYDIGCLWAVYNMAVIIAIRSHPHMPPAAHAAAAVAAQETYFYANEIGRIVAGIVPGPPDQTLNPNLGAALCESCMPSFFAAVQYRTPEQRHTTVMRILGIAHCTGWGSAELIANGCETAWVRAADAGRGPPYKRAARSLHSTQSEDPRLNGSWEQLDPDVVPDEKDEDDRRLVKRNPKARLNWAIGVMGTEEDVEKVPKK